MKWRNRRQSTNVDDRRAQTGASPMGSARLPSLGTIVFLLPVVKRLLRSKAGLAILAVGAVIWLGRSKNLGSLIGGDRYAATGSAQEDELAAFVKTVLADTEAVWTEVFADAGLRYPPPTLVLYRGATTSGCGKADSRMGPFYCPVDQKVYVDLGFYEDLRREQGVGGDFAQAYVLAHEIGHHVQNLAGTLNEVQRAQQRLRGDAQKNQLQVGLELQADCYAGVWANHAQRQFDMLEPGDLEEALTAAAAIGDDRLQKQAQGFAIPHTFTHGTSKQRATWFARGVKDGTLAACNTFED
jgi:hypothetical protein